MNGVQFSRMKCSPRSLVAIVAVVIVSSSVVWITGNALLKQFQVNDAMLHALYHIRRSDEKICPTLILAKQSDLEIRLAELDASPIERLQELKGLYLLADQRPQEAMLFLARSTHPNRVQAFWRACAAFESGNIADAISFWQYADAVDYFVKRGAISLSQGNERKAIELYGLATHIAPSEGQAWLGLTQSQLGLAYTDKVSWQETLDSAEHALALLPNEPQAHYLVGAALLGGRTDLPRAERELRWTYGRRGGWLEKYVLGIALLEQGNLSESTKLLEEALRQQDNAVIRYHLTRAYFLRGECDLAFQAKSTAIVLYPHLQDELDSICQRNTTCPCSTNP